MIKLKFWIYSLLAIALLAANVLLGLRFVLTGLDEAAGTRLERAVLRVERARDRRDVALSAYANSVARLAPVRDALAAGARLEGRPPTLNVTKAQEAIAMVPLEGGVRPSVAVVLSTPTGASRARLGEAVEEGVDTAKMSWLSKVHAGGTELTMSPAGKSGLQQVVSVPVRSGEAVLGAVTLFFPVDAGYLSALAPEIGTGLTVAVGETVVSTSEALGLAGAIAKASKSASPKSVTPFGEATDLKVLPLLAPALGRTKPAAGYGRKVPLPGVSGAALICTTDSQKKLAAFDEIVVFWVGSIGLLLAMALFWGFFVASGSGIRWAKLMNSELEKVAAGGLAYRVDSKRFSKVFRGPMDRLNEILDQASQGAGAGGMAGQVLAHRDADISSLLGDGPVADEPSVSDFQFGGLEGAPGEEGAAAAGMEMMDPPANAPLEGTAPEVDPSFDPFGGQPPAPPPEADLGGQGDFDPFGANTAPPPAPPAPPPQASAPEPDPFASEMSQDASAGDYFSDSTRVVNLNDLAAQEQAQVHAQPAPDAADPFAAAYSEGGPGPEEEGHDATVVARVPDALLAATARAQGGAATRDPDEEHFRQVFQDFVSTRRQCGESADGLTYEKFAAKLKKNRDAIKDKHAARSVRFQVHVKAGKAALKATPVK